MAAQTNDWKLGLFVSLSAAVVFVSIAALGASNLDETYIYYETYLDESVQGLEYGSPVKFRGAPVGSVSEIGVAPDGSSVRVVFDMKASRLFELGFQPKDEEQRKRLSAGGRIPGSFENWPRELRIQLVSAGITGMKFLQIDVFKGEEIPAYDFALPVNFCPPAPSSMKSIEESVITTLHRAPQIADELTTALAKLNTKLDALDVEGLSSSANELLEKGNKKLDALEVGELNDAAKATLDELKATLEKASQTLDRLNAEDGALERLEGVARNLDAQVAKIDLEQTIGKIDRTADAATETADTLTQVLGRGQLAQTLLTIEQAAASLRRLVDALERDSDMLIKGRALGGKR